MQSLINLLGVLVWPAVVVAIGRYIIKYIDKLLKLKEPMSDTYYQELKEELKAIKSEINSIRISKGMEREE